MFFKTNSKAAVNALNKFFNDREALVKSANAFAEEFDADAIIANSGADVRFAGIVFKNPSKVNFDIWRKPCRQNFKISHLRVKPVKKELTEQWQAERQKWDSLKEKYFQNGDTVSPNDFYNTIGLNWGDLFFNSFNSFINGNTLYIETSITKVTNAIEILGSEFNKAKKLNNSIKKAKLQKVNDIPWAHRITGNGTYEIGYFGESGFVKTDEAETLEDAKMIVETYNGA